MAHEVNNATENVDRFMMYVREQYSRSYYIVSKQKYIFSKTIEWNKFAQTDSLVLRMNLFYPIY